MIQRIQSFYLLLVILLSASLSYGFFVTEYAVKLASLFFESFGFFAILILAIISLLLYTKRKLQILFCLFLILLNLIPVIIYGYMIFNGSEEMIHYAVVSISLIETLFLILAHQAILKDEKLVRSIDRIR